MLVIIAVLGVIIGVLIAGTRIPQFRRIEALCVSLVLLGAVIFVIFEGPSDFPTWLLFLAGSLVGSQLYAGVIWKKARPDVNRGYWRWVWDDLTNERYLRRSYKEYRRYREQLPDLPSA